MARTSKTEKTTVTLAELDLLSDPRVRAAYDAMAPEFAVARAIIAARAAAGLSQAALARRMATSQSFIARLESGRVMPSMRTFLRVAKATGTRPSFGLEAN
ncbi:MAG: XRE family transcriptional regulator [Alphaproteobacteria bacterium]|nr:XRE family transcriptional regulator [Alphaproteobacteria bacterium]